MIEQSDFAILDMRYKKLEDCEKDMKTSETQTHSIDTRMAVLEHGQKITNWLLAAIGSGLVALLIKVFLGGG